MLSTILIYDLFQESQNDTQNDTLDYSNLDDRKKDEDWVNYEEERGVKRPEIFSEVIKAAMRYDISIAALCLIINLVLQAVRMDHLYVSKAGLEKWQRNTGETSVAEYEKEMQGLVCLKADGKTSEVAVGHNQTVRKHNLSIIKEGCKADPTPKYVDHVESGESGVAMAGKIMDVIENTNSTESLLAIGAGNYCLNTVI